MTEKNNKIKYGLKNVHRAKIINTDGVITYGTPTPIKGAVTLSVSPEVTRTPIPADDNPEYSVMIEDNGYAGDIEFQYLSDEDRVEIFGNTLNEDGVLVENKDDTPNPIALLFEFSGDAHATRHILYNCLCTKPNVESETGKTNKTDKMPITARPAEDTGHVKAKVANKAATKAIYDNWYKNVYIPENAVAEGE